MPGYRLRRAAALALALGLAACAPPPPPPALPAAVATQHLAAFQDPALHPEPFAALPFEAGRSYVVLIQLPAPAVVRLDDPAAAQAGLRGFLDPVAVAQAGTMLGHAMLGWRCADDPRPGLIAKSGDRAGLGRRLALAGWGMAGALGGFRSGLIETPARPGSRQARALARGGARIVALETDLAGCRALRGALAEVLADPEGRVRPYSMIADPAAPLGTGCGGFMWEMAGRAAALGGLPGRLVRPVPLSDRYLGRGRPLTPCEAAQVVPLVREGAGRIGPVALIGRDWRGGASLGSVAVLDMELSLLALDRAYARAGPGWARAPRLPAEDPAAAAVARAADQALARWRRVTPVRIGAARAVMLHRR